LAGDPSTWSAAQAREIALGPTFGSGGSLETVTCTSSTACVAAGYDYNGNENGQPIVLARAPSSWGVAQAPALTLGARWGSGGMVWSVACAELSLCLAVGNDANHQPFVLSGDPSSWSAAQAYEVTLGSGFGSKGWVYSVTCPSASSCIAVGTDGNSQPLVV